MSVALYGWLAGTTVYCGTLVAAHRWVAPRVLGGLHRPRLAAAVGAAAVTCGGVLAGVTFDAVLYSAPCPSYDRGPWSPWLRASAYALSGLAGFALAGGRWRAIAPSHLAHPGSYAVRGGSVPAAGASYASPKQRAVIAAAGRRFGCHSCGKRWLTEWICDHQPPNKISAESGGPQRFFPQCITCSKAQGASLGLGDGASVFFHVPQGLRLYHIWWPLGPLFFFLWPESTLTVDELLLSPATENSSFNSDGDETAFSQRVDASAGTDASSHDTDPRDERIAGLIADTKARMAVARRNRDFAAVALARDDLEVLHLMQQHRDRSVAL